MDSSFPIEKYTCIPYVFDLVDEPNCKEISQLGVGRVFPSPKFVEFLINRKYLKEIKHKNDQVGDIVLYSDDNEIKHVGKLIEKDRFISKWGIGYLYEHNIFEVPISYGNNISFFKSINREEAIKYFIEYAVSEGIIEYNN